jgi:hypothetical protein
MTARNTRKPRFHAKVPGSLSVDFYLLFCLPWASLGTKRPPRKSKDKQSRKLPFALFSEALNTSTLLPVPE